MLNYIIANIYNEHDGVYVTVKSLLCPGSLYHMFHAYYMMNK